MEPLVYQGNALLFPLVLKFLFPPSLGLVKAQARAELFESAFSQAVRRPARVLIATSYADMEARALSSEFDVIWAPSGICARVEPSCRYVFKVVRAGSSSYRAAIVCRRGTGTSLSSLKGLRAAWVDPYSVGGYLLARDLLAGQGVSPDSTFASQSFLGSHPAVLSALLHDEADVGAVTVSNSDPEAIRDSINSYMQGAASRFDVIGISEGAPTDAIVVTNHVRSKAARELASILCPEGMDARPPASLLGVLEADTLVRCHRGEYLGVLRLLRSAGLLSQ